ncbi:hypothetical protein JRO89_XS01G0242500 [Xanthoceras sorbifolium]|uniref:Protein kinase domain-containing protein n=1 Tax=Xanthoceras sorbifolium TaxID=99658 RepID=A0ABQ8IL55_9ROSI|nr:hypothetical protein JRO89_XS01G0242500 [Xanthoceras sorbifolium]
MGKLILCSYDWRWLKYPNPPLVLCIFFMIIVVQELVLCQPSAEDCSLDFQFTLIISNSSCEGGDWGGFLPKNCSGSEFCNYLYALGHRANQTGKIFLNSSDQRSCLASMKRFEGDVFGCGIEKLTSGAGGCSDYSVADVTNKLGDELRSLNENCKFTSSVGEWNQTCGSCVRSWEGIRGSHSGFSDHESIENEADICRFAVMVALTSSRIEDEMYAQNVYKCLAEENSYKEDQTSDSKKKTLSTAFRDVQLKDPGCPKFPSKEIYSATNNLNELNLIGEGTAGKVYKGVLSNNQHAAIKHIVNDGNVETFVREVTSLSHIRHPNLVALLGYCLREDEGFLIYELCPNGNLSNWLFGKDKVLSWIKRLHIAIDSARGLLFLHTYSEGCIVHRDIKPTNILLGPNFEAKLSDFGLSKVMDLGETHVSSEVRGTFGYVDPEYQSNCHVNSSGDVYSFGIVLLQILSGKRVINMNVKKPMPIDKMAKLLTRVGSTKGLVDPKLEGEYSVEAFDLTLQLALSCTAVVQQRPSMEQVVATLEKALDKSTTAKASTPGTSPNLQPSTP